MSVVSGDILRLTVFQRLGGQQVLNVQFCQYDDVGGSGNTYAEIASQYGLGFRNACAPVQSVELTYEKVVVDNITNGLEFGEVVNAGTGTEGVEYSSTFLAASVKQVRESKLTRNGSKRLAGIPESKVTNGLLQFTLAETTAIEDFFGQTQLFTGGAINDFELIPVIVGRTLNPVTGNYELDLNKINFIQQAQVLNQVTSQNTRKPRNT